MEALLSLSFDNISSKDSAKIRKGLRQIEGLLAQICLSASSSQSQSTSKRDRRASAVPASNSEPKTLAGLPGDPAFREFFRIQDGFEWNVASRLINCLERLLGMGSSGSNDLLILSALDVLHGILLLHPPSRSLFSREIYMNLLLDLLDTSNPPAIQSHTLLVLVTSLLQHPLNTRAFEATDGPLAVTSLFKSRSTTREVKLRVIEFLYFYLMPEMPNEDVGGGGTAIRNGGKEGLAAVFEKKDRGTERRMMMAENTKTTEEKQVLLGRYLSNVEDLVQDLRETQPFGGAVC